MNNNPSAGSSPSFCTQCGTALGLNVRFCGKCGSKIGGNVENAVTWQLNVPLINNRFILGDTVMGCLLTTALAAIFFGVIFGIGGGGKGVLQGLMFAGVAGLGLLVFSFLVLLVFFGNRYPMEFTIQESGLSVVSRSDRAHKANRLALILGVLAGKPGLAGAGLMATSRELRSLRWEEVRSVQKYPHERVILVKGGFLERLHVFCTPDNFEKASKLIETLTAKASSNPSG